MRVIEHGLTKSQGICFTAALIAAALFGSVYAIAKPILFTIDPFLLSSLVYLISAALFSAIIALRKNYINSIITIANRIFIF